MADRLGSGQIQICRRPDSFCPDFQFASANRTKIFTPILNPDRIRTYPDNATCNLLLAGHFYHATPFAEQRRSYGTTTLVSLTKSDFWPCIRLTLTDSFPELQCFIRDCDMCCSFPGCTNGLRGREIAFQLRKLWRWKNWN